MHARDGGGEESESARKSDDERMKEKEGERNYVGVRKEKERDGQAHRTGDRGATGMRGEEFWHRVQVSKLLARSTFGCSRWLRGLQRCE